MVKLLKHLEELVFPEECLHCKIKTSVQNNIPLCFNCELQLESAWSNQDNLLKSRFKGVINVKYALTQFYFITNGVSQSIIHEAKYSGQTDILNHFAHVMAHKITKNNLLPDLPDLITPVPNNWMKRLKLGYNQAEIYSSSLAKTLDIEHSSRQLKKRHDRTSQTKRNKLQRFKHLSNLYYLKHPETIKGKHVLLVDDVITSGATIETCVNLLTNAGAEKVSILAFMLVK